MNPSVIAHYVQSLSSGEFIAFVGFTIMAMVDPRMVGALIFVALLIARFW